MDRSRRNPKSTRFSIHGIWDTLWRKTDTEASKDASHARFLAVELLENPLSIGDIPHHSHSNRAQSSCSQIKITLKGIDPNRHQFYEMELMRITVRIILSICVWGKHYGVYWLLIGVSRAQYRSVLGWSPRWDAATRIFYGILVKWKQGIFLAWWSDIAGMPASQITDRRVRTRL